MSVLVTIALGGCQPSPAGTSPASNEPAPPMAETKQQCRDDSQWTLTAPLLAPPEDEPAR